MVIIPFTPSPRSSPPLPLAFQPKTIQNSAMTTIHDLSTPALLVDIDKLESNIRNWQSEIGANGVALRPHVKTHKVPDIAKMQLAAGSPGITVAKLAEAEVFVTHGFRDIFVAYPVIGPDKWTRAAQLASQIKLIVGVDSETGARGLSAAASAAGNTINVRVEIDTGMHRAGIPASSALDLCRLVQSLPGLMLDGLFTFRGAGFAGSEGRSAEEVGLEEGQIMVDLADELRSNGVPIQSISVGSTPTSKYAARVKGVTEVRPGTYVFSDYITAEKGYVPYEDVALSIVCTVVSKSAPDKFTIDGGSKTFCGDIPYMRMGMKGYAKAIGMEAYLVSMSEEHGVVQIEGEHIDVKIGDRIAFYPIHVCTTVNLSDELIGVRNGQIEKTWPILARGKRT